MDVVSFQKKLEDILKLAKLNGKRISKEGAALLFKGELSSEQMEKVYDYLRLQGIRLIGEEREEELPKDAAGIIEKETAPLTAEEEHYLRAYEISLKKPGEGTTLENYMWDVISIARELHHEEMFVGDLIAEGNLCLTMALAEEIGEREEVLAAVRAGMKKALEEQTRQKYQDDFLVEKVRRLEESIRNLAEGVEEKSSIEELSAYLDMEEEEIRAVLKLTGDLDD